MAEGKACDMQTPLSYKESLKNGIITKDMLRDCVLSADERARSYDIRLKKKAARLACLEKRQRRNPTRRYREVTDNRTYLSKKRDECYRTKARLLSYAKPTEIHETIIQQWARVNSTDFATMGQYQRKHDSDIKAGRAGNANTRTDPKTGQKTPFYDVIVISPSFYIYYDFGNGRTFHTPIDAEEIRQCQERYGIRIVKLGGKTITRRRPCPTDELISPQFVRRVLTALDDGTARIQDDNPYAD